MEEDGERWEERERGRERMGRRRERFISVLIEATQLSFWNDCEVNGSPENGSMEQFLGRKESNSVSECELCNEEYDEGIRKPRSLPCSHTICSDCTDQLILRNNQSCPYCRRRFDATSVRDVGVNFGLLEALKLIRKMEEESSTKKASSNVSSNWKDEFRKENEDIANQNISFCRESQEKIDTKLKENNEILNCLIQENEIIENEIKVEMNNIVTTNKQRIRYLQEENRSFSSLKKTLEEKQSQSQNAVRKLAEVTTSKDISTIIGDIEKTSSDVKTLIGTLTKVISAEEKVKTQIDKATKRMKDKVRILQEVLHSTPEEDEELKLIPDLYLTTMDERIDVTIETLRGRTEPVMELLRQGRIFAQQQLHGRQIVAPISVSEENRICLHYLREETLQDDAYILMHRDVMNLVDSSSRLAFLELSNERNEKLGRMYIRIEPQTKRAQQFSLMCTGRVGPCFANTKALNVSAKGQHKESIIFGDYENQDGTGGKALVSGVWEEDHRCIRPWLGGSVWGSTISRGEDIATQFAIFTKTRSRYNYPYIFGIVEEGLHVLREAVKTYPNIEDIVISDCGLVLEV